MTRLDPIEELVARALEASEAEGPQALHRLCEEHPEEAGELRERFAVLREMGLAQPPRDQHPERLGAWELVEPIGGGGMGIVYRARHDDGREVALKVIRPERLFFPGATERFGREVAAVARLEHPGIARIHAVGEEDGVPFFAMELLEGATLASVLARFEGRSPESLTGPDLASAIAELTGQSAAAVAGSWQDACLRVARQIAAALAHAHERGVVHRDVKPSNIMLTPAGRALLIDFGLARTERPSTLTVTGAQPGSLPYMAPEQVRGDEADARSDVYSLGATLYEMLTLRSPHLAPTAEATRQGILLQDPVPVRTLDRAVSVDAETVVQCAMDKEPRRRYATAGALAADLDRVLERRPVAAQRAGPALRVQRWLQRNRAAGVAMLLGLLLLVGVPSTLWLQQRAHARSVERALRVAEGHRLTAASAKLLPTNPGLALLAAIEGADRHRDREANTALALATAACHELRTLSVPRRSRCVAFSADGSRVACGARDGTARVFDAADGAVIHELEHGGGVTDVAFHPDGRRLLTAGTDGRARLWSLADGTCVRTYEHAGALRCAALCPRAEQLALTSENGAVAVFDVASGTRTRSLVGHTDIVYHAAFDHAGRRLVTASEDRSARVWSLADDTPPVVLQLPEAASAYWGAIWHAEFSKDDARVLTPVCDGSCRIWDAATGALLVTMKGHFQTVLYAGYSPDGSCVLSTSTGGTACLWDAASGALLHRLRGHTSSIWKGTWSPDGRSVATASWDGTVRVWDTGSGVLLGVLRGHTDRVWEVAFRNDGRRLVSVSDDATARIWEYPRRHEIPAHADRITAIAFSHDGARAATACADGSAKVWNAADWTPVCTVNGHRGRVLHVGFDGPGQRLLTTSSDGTACVWEVPTGRLVSRLAGHEVPVSWGAFAEGGASVLTVCSGIVRKWDSAAGRCLVRHELKRSGLRDCQLSSDQTVLTGLAGALKRAFRFDVPTGTGSIEDGTPIWHRRVAPGGRAALLVHGSWATLQDGRTRRLALDDGHRYGPSAFSPGLRFLAIGHWKGSVRLFSLRDETYRDLSRGDSPIASVSFDASGEWLLTRTTGGRATVWSTRTGHELLALDPPEGRLACAAFTPGDRRIVTGSTTGVLHVLAVDPDPLRSALARRPRRLTAAERRRLGLEAR